MARSILSLALAATTVGCAHFSEAHDRMMDSTPSTQTGEAVAPSEQRAATKAAQSAPEPRHGESGKGGAVAAGDGTTGSDIIVSASASAVIIFANVPDSGCIHCSSTRISVAPSGKVLVEEGRWSGDNWHYRRSIAHVGPARALAFSQRLSDARPTGRKTLSGRAGCTLPGSQMGSLAIDWIEGERHDQLNLMLACPSQSDAGATQSLLHAPELLRMRQLNFPWLARQR